MTRKITYTLILIALLLAACSPTMPPTMILPTASSEEAEPEIVDLTPYPTRPAYAPGELVEYTAQAGDMLPGLAARFNTTIDEIRAANTIIPDDATTMPPGMPMQIPVYYRPLWGTPFQILPDAAFVNGPDTVEFDTDSFISENQGWLRFYNNYAFLGTRTAAEIIDYVALHYSVSPKLLIALLEYQGGALSAPYIRETEERNILGLESDRWTGVYQQLAQVSDILNDGYYRWREGDLIEFELEDGSIIRPDPWQNAATVALQYFFSQIMSVPDFHRAIGPDGFITSYQHYFGDPWQLEPHIPGSLKQPEMQMPFITNKNEWAYTGGPHSPWGNLAPWAALDFAPPSPQRGCVQSFEWVGASLPGLVVRSGDGVVVIDHDGDGYEQTGWVLFYLHIATNSDLVSVGEWVEVGDRIGNPSCEGGRATGTHVHVARKYNGEWLPADGVIPFVLSGWEPIRGIQPYTGWLVKDDMRVLANSTPNNLSFIPVEYD